MNEFTDFKTYKMKNQKTYQYVFDYFSEQILSGELKINDKILPEREIAEKLDVSRNSIREVMHMLEINGLLDCRQGSGNYLRCEPQDYMVKFMNMVMSLQQIKYTEVYDIRMGYETVALRLAIKNATEEEIEEMHQILIKMDEIEDPKESGKLDMQFHNKLIEASHNRMIVLYTSMIAELINQFIADFRVRIMANQRQADALRRAHWNIYDSLVAKDFVAGSFAMQRHFDIVGEQLERLQQQMENQGKIKTSVCFLFIFFDVSETNRSFFLDFYFRDIL